MMSKTRGPLPPIILLTVIALQIALHHWLPIASLVPAPWNGIGIAVIACGLGIVAGPVMAFVRARTTIVPFQESASLVTAGLYRITRNPMYLGMLAILLGNALWCGTLSPFIGPLLFVPLLNARIIRHEEAMLEERFGEEYRDYKRRVRRWI